MIVLAIDPGTNLGWAMLLNGTIYSGVQRFNISRDESPGMRWLRFSSWLYEINKQAGGNIDVIYHERPHHRGGAATAVLEGFVSHLQTFAAQIGAEIKAVHSGTLKKFATGKGNAGKDEMIQAAISKFISPTLPVVIDDNHADALHLLSLAMAELGVK